MARRPDGWLIRTTGRLAGLGAMAPHAVLAAVAHGPFAGCGSRGPGPCAALRAVRGVHRQARVGTHAAHCHATLRLESGCDIRTVQALHDHKDVRTTPVYTRVFDCGGPGVISPLDGWSLAGAFGRPESG